MGLAAMMANIMSQDKMRALKPGIIPQKISKNVGKRLIRQR